MKYISEKSVSSLSFSVSMLDQTDRSSLFQPYTCLDLGDGNQFLAKNPGYAAYTRKGSVVQNLRTSSAWRVGAGGS
jgi:hypothetical protein